MENFIGFDYQFADFVDEHLCAITNENSREDCFGEIFEWKLDVEKSKISRRLSGAVRWSKDEKNQINQRAYHLFLEWLSGRKTNLKHFNCETALTKLQNDFENGLPSNNESLHWSSQKNCAEKINELLKRLLQTVTDQNSKMYYSFAVFSVLWFFVTNGTEAVSAPIELKKLMEEVELEKANISTNSSPLFESLLLISSALYPDKHTVGFSEKKVALTRYALFSLVKKLYPDEISLLDLLANENKTPDELTSEFEKITVSVPELSSLRTQVEFAWHYNANGKKSGMITMQIKHTAAEPIEPIKYKQALDLLLSAYMDLPEEFHNNVASILKRELNTTVSLLTLSVANTNYFCRSEHNRAELLTICDSLIKTHNHHSSYMFSLVERSADEANYLFKEYRKGDYECQRAVELFENFFDDNWQTEQSATYFGKKFLIWCKDEDIVLQLINRHCFNPHIWNELSSRGYNDALRTFTKRNIYDCYLRMRENEYKNTVVSFLQMISISQGGFKYLARSKSDPEFNKSVIAFIKALVKNIPLFPQNKQSMLQQGIITILKGTNGYDPSGEHTTSKQILNELDVDLSLNHYRIIRDYRDRIFKIMPPSTKQQSIDIIEELNAITNNGAIALQVTDDLAKKLRLYLFDKSVWLDDERKNAVYTIMDAVLETNPWKYYLTILSSSERFYIFPDIIQNKICRFAISFLEQCDYSVQQSNSVERAIAIINQSNCNDSSKALKRCFVNLSKIKDCRPIVILRLFLKKFSSDEFVEILQKQHNDESKEFSETICWLLADKNNRKLLDNALYDNIIFDFVSTLIDEMNKETINEQVSTAIIHFAKRQECFMDKVPMTDEFYSRLLLDPDVSCLDMNYLKRIARENALSDGTALYHLCWVLKDYPKRTAYICIEYLAKIYGDIEYLYNNKSDFDIRHSKRFQKRMEIFRLVVSNPSIINTSKFYCAKMRRYATLLPPRIREMIINVADKGIYPAWIANAFLKEYDQIKEIPVWLSMLKHNDSNREATKKLEDEIENKLIPWLEQSNTDIDVYQPRTFILTVFENGEYKVIDGNRIVSHFLKSSIGFKDFKVNTMVVTI